MNKQGLEQRILWVLSNRRNVIRSARGWCKKAGLSTGYLGVTRSRIHSDGDDVVPTHTLEKLADAALVSREWFVYGRGEPLDNIATPAVPTVPPPSSMVMPSGSFYDLLIWFYETPSLADVVNAHRDVSAADLERLREHGLAGHEGPINIYKRIRELRNA